MYKSLAQLTKIKTLVCGRVAHVKMVAFFVRGWGCGGRLGASGAKLQRIFGGLPDKSLAESHKLIWFDAPTLAGRVKIMSYDRNEIEIRAAT